MISLTKTARNILVLHCGRLTPSLLDPRLLKPLIDAGCCFPAASSTSLNPEIARASLMTGSLNPGPGQKHLGEIFSDAGFECVHWGAVRHPETLRGFTLLPADSRVPEAEFCKTDSLTEILCAEFLKSNRPKRFLGFAEIDSIRDFQALAEGQSSAVTPQDNPDSREEYNRYAETAIARITGILESLKIGPNGETTSVILIADIGLPAGPGTGFHRQTINVPFILSGPGTGKPGRVFGAVLASTADLVPTLCGLAGIDLPGNSYARDLTKVLLSQEGTSPPSPRDMAAASADNPASRMIRSFSYKYSHYSATGKEDLFRLTPDPDEKENLAEHRGYLDTLIYHRRLMKKHLDNERDNYPFPFVKFSQ